MEIPIIIICVALMLIVGYCYQLHCKYDAALEVISEAAIELANHKKEIEELKTTASAAEELIEAAKELTEEQAKSEKAFREAFESIVNY